MSLQTPLQLESYFVEQLTYEARQGFDQAKPPHEQLDVNVEAKQHRQARDRIMVRLRLTLGAGESRNPRCLLDLRLVGFFVLAAGLEEKLRNAMISQNAPSILYGIARQIVAETAGNGPWGKIFLGTANFAAMSTGAPQTAVSAQSKSRPPVAHDRPTRDNAKARPPRERKRNA